MLNDNLCLFCIDYYQTLAFEPPSTAPVCSASATVSLQHEYQGTNSVQSHLAIPPILCSPVVRSRASSLSSTATGQSTGQSGTITLNYGECQLRWIYLKCASNATRKF